MPGTSERHLPALLGFHPCLPRYSVKTASSVAGLSTPGEPDPSGKDPNFPLGLLDASLLKAEAWRIKSQITSGCYMTMKTFPGEGTQEGAPGRTGKEESYSWVSSCPNPSNW